MPITLVASLIDPHTLEPFEPSEERRAFFQSATNTEYSPPVIPDLDFAHTMRCPLCVDRTELSIRYWNVTGTGWAQPNFKVTCPVCYQAFTKETMGIRKFCDELALKRAGGRIFFSYESRHGERAAS